MTIDQGALATAQERLREPHLPCQQVPDMEFEDVRTVRDAAWQRIRELGSPLDAPGDRLYILSFIGSTPYIEVGRTTNLMRRTRSHERDALVHRCSLFDAWVFRPYPSARKAARSGSMRGWDSVPEAIRRSRATSSGRRAPSSASVPSLGQEDGVPEQVAFRHPERPTRPRCVPGTPPVGLCGASRDHAQL